MAKFGHCTGRKRERKGSQDWYRTIEKANIKAVDATWNAQPPRGSDEKAGVSAYNNPTAQV